MEVIAVTANSGYDANTGERGDEETEKELPGTVTLLVTPEQGKVLAELEAEGKLHLSLVYRGTKENARKFVEAQEMLLEELIHQKEKKIWRRMKAELRKQNQQKMAKKQNRERSRSQPQKVRAGWNRC